MSYFMRAAEAYAGRPGDGELSNLIEAALELRRSRRERPRDLLPADDTADAHRPCTGSVGAIRGGIVHAKDSPMLRAEAAFGRIVPRFAKPIAEDGE